MKCPYCKTGKVKPPDRGTPHPHGTCLNCGRHPRATVEFRNGVETVVKYSTEGCEPLDERSVKGKVYQLRLSRNDVTGVETGVKVIKILPNKKGIKTLTLVDIVVQ